VQTIHAFGLAGKKRQFLLAGIKKQACQQNTKGSSLPHQEPSLSSGFHQFGN
jgi:hypothetical protein